MTKQQQIDALTAENVRMSFLLQSVADHLPGLKKLIATIPNIARTSTWGEFTITEKIVDEWLQYLYEMDITPSSEEPTT